MGTTIEGLALLAGARHRTRGARRLLDAAVTAAVGRAGLVPGDVDLLLNAGLYHDRLLGEPALAALIQEDVGANVEDPHPGGHGTFSFDVANGACGPLTSLQIADGFLRAGTIRHAAIVAGDADPGHRTAPGFPFEPAAAAVVCGWDPDAAGIVGFHWQHSPAADDSWRALVSFAHGRNELRVEVDPRFYEDAAALAGKTAVELLARCGTSAASVDLVVANPFDARFLRPLAPHLSIDPDRIVQPAHPNRFHTAGLLAALHEAGDAAAGRVLLVSAGAGLVAGAALLER